MKSDAPDVPWIKDGKCINDGKYICNLGFACDGCPYNKDETAKAKHYAFPKSKVDLKKVKRRRRVCCACKKERKIVNIGGPPLCKDCYPLARNWSEVLQDQERFWRSLAGFDTMIFHTGIDDVDYMLELMSEDLAEAKMKIKQAEVCMLNIQSAIHSEKEWEKKKVKK